jgi:hypothetical protein
MMTHKDKCTLWLGILLEIGSDLFDREHHVRSGASTIEEFCPK